MRPATAFQDKVMQAAPQEDSNKYKVCDTHDTDWRSQLCSICCSRLP